MADGGFLWLAGVAIFASLISLYYYLQVLRQMYIERPPNPDHAERGSTNSAEDHGDAHGHGDHDELPPVAPDAPSIAAAHRHHGRGPAGGDLAGRLPGKPLLGLIDAASAAIVPLG